MSVRLMTSLRNYSFDDLSQAQFVREGMLSPKLSRRFALLPNSLTRVRGLDVRPDFGRRWIRLVRIWTLGGTFGLSLMGAWMHSLPVRAAGPPVAVATDAGQAVDFAAFLSRVSESNSSFDVPDDTVEIVDTVEMVDPLSQSTFQASDATGMGNSNETSETGWWRSAAHGYLLESPDFVQVDVATLMTNTLESSPRISAISRRTSIAYEKIVQQEAVFDPSLLLETGYGRVNDPVGNTLVTGGPLRSIEDSFTASGGIQKLTKLGTSIDLNQEIGTLQSNSLFFEPAHQGNSRLSLSITQPLMATSGRVYNTRLITQASIDSRIAWQQLRVDLENHLIETLTTFWRLYERRSQLVQQRALIQRGELLGQIVNSRAEFDSGPLQQIKVTRRLAGDRDRRIELDAEVERLQVRLKTLVGDPSLIATNDRLEFIPLANPDLPSEALNVRDCVVRGLEHRADILAATQQLSASGLEVNITKNELMPRLNAVIDAYLAGLEGRNNIGQSLVNQFSDGGPGVTAALTYNLPWGRRAAKSRHREARYRYQQRSEELREALLVARREIESALIKVRASDEMRQSKAATLAASAREEAISTRRWEALSGDGGPMALVLEDLLETQKRRTDAEQAYVTAQVNYVLDMISLQQAMGTFLIREGVEAVRPGQTSVIDIIQTAPVSEQSYSMDVWDEGRPSIEPELIQDPEPAFSEPATPGMTPGMTLDEGMLEGTGVRGGEGISNGSWALPQPVQLNEEMQ